MKTHCFILLAIPFLFACAPKKTEVKELPLVLIAQAGVAQIPVLIDPPPVGHVMPYSTVTIRPLIGGTISKVHFLEGREVAQGDLLFTIDPRPSQAALEGAQAALARDQAQLANAQVQFGRDQKLVAQKIESQDVMDSSQANRDALIGTVANDQSAVTNAQLNLEYTQIRSPLNGLAGQLQFHEGNVVKSPDDTLLVINQIRPIYVAFAVPERYLPEIRHQAALHTLKARVTFENQAGTPPEGDLVFVDNTVDCTTGTIMLKALFTNENSTLWPGQFVQVSMVLEEMDHAVVVPSQAVQTGQKGTYIYVVKEDLTVDERTVVIGPAYQGNTVIESGLKEGETVVTDGQLRLTPNVKVSIKPADQPAAK
jgi:multidrug efflux system membrane fusion protein